jgi:hypothetical protein
MAVELENHAPPGAEVRSRAVPKKNLPAPLLAFATVLFSFMGGMNLSDGLDQWQGLGNEHRPLSNILRGLGMLLVAIAFVLQLVEKTRAVADPTETNGR